MAWVFPIVTVILGILITGTIQRQLPCPQCQNISDPICGRSGVTGNDRTFLNQCLMQVANCDGTEEYTLLHQGECAPVTRECISFCTGTHKPTCTVYDFAGQWGNYSNECLLNKRNCDSMPNGKKISEGPCQLNVPVCGQYANGKKEIFPNYCSLLVKNCELPGAGLEKVFDNECLETPTTAKVSTVPSSTESGVSTSTGSNRPTRPGTKEGPRVPPSPRFPDRGTTDRPTSGGTGSSSDTGNGVPKIDENVLPTSAGNDWLPSTEIYGVTQMQQWRRPSPHHGKRRNEASYYENPLIFS